MKDIDADAVEQRGDSAAGKSEEWRNDYNKMVGEKAKRRLATMITINNKLMEKATQELKSTLHEIGNGTGRPPSRRREDDLPETPLHREGQQIDTHHAGMPGGEKPPEVMHGAGGAADPAGDDPEPAPSGGGATSREWPLMIMSIQFRPVPSAKMSSGWLTLRRRPFKSRKN